MRKHMWMVSLFIIIIASSILSVNSFQHKYSLAEFESPNRTTDNEYYNRNPRMPMPSMHLPHWNGKTHSQHTMRLEQRRNNSEFHNFTKCTGMLFGQFSIGGHKRLNTHALSHNSNGKKGTEMKINMNRSYALWTELGVCTNGEPADSERDRERERPECGRLSKSFHGKSF